MVQSLIPGPRDAHRLAGLITDLTCMNTVMEDKDLHSHVLYTCIRAIVLHVYMWRIHGSCMLYTC